MYYVFMKREETGVASQSPGLDKSIGKSKRQFQLDLYVVMAKLGSQLLSALTLQVNPESGTDPVGARPAADARATDHNPDRAHRSNTTAICLAMGVGLFISVTELRRRGRRQVLRGT
jgi:hypothetical protein